MKQAFLFIMLIFSLSRAADEFTPQGTYYPNFFAELLDAEMYSDDVLYMVGVGGFVFMDVRNPQNPKLIGRLDPGSIYKRFYNGKAAGSLAIGAARQDGLYFINISNMNSPRMHTIHKSDGITYESVDFRNGFAYAAAHENGVEVFNIEDPAEPSLVSVIKGLANAWDVYVDNNMLYVADGPGGLRIYSLGDPADPVLVGTVPASGYAREVIVSGNRAYLALGAAGFDIIDIRTPDNPAFMSNFNPGFGILNHLNLVDDVLFAASWELVYAVDVSDPHQPVLLATEDTPIRAMGLAAYGEHVYVTDWGTLETYTFLQFDSPDIHVKPTVYDFGYGGANVAVEKEFSIHNLGETDLVVSDVSVNNEDFTISEKAFTVPAGSVHDILLTYQPDNLTYSSPSLKIVSNDPDEQTVRVDLFTGGDRIGPGDRAPYFELKDLDGNLHKLSDYKGKILLLAFFASW